MAWVTILTAAFFVALTAFLVIIKNWVFMEAISLVMGLGVVFIFFLIALLYFITPSDQRAKIFLVLKESFYKEYKALIEALKCWR
jgi:hypothetical protein